MTASKKTDRLSRADRTLLAAARAAARGTVEGKTTGQETAGEPGSSRAGRLWRPVVGLEAEFSLHVNDQPRRPEDVFGSPRSLVRAALGAGTRVIPRLGRSCQLPSGGALYFDSGVVEVATGLIELDGPASIHRAVRSLWEQVVWTRRGLDAWERRTGDALRLQGFSAHYNFSQHGVGPHRLRRVARLLCYLLPAPVWLLAANRHSTAVGARPRPERLEITVDFTPDPALTVACLACLAGVIRALSRWPDADLEPAALLARGLPVPRSFRPRPHSSRRGWRAHVDDLPRHPGQGDPDAPDWSLADGRRVSLRAAAAEILAHFATDIGRFADPETLVHLRGVTLGTARSLLDFPGRPPAYDDVGRLVDWGRRSRRRLPRSAYERVIRRVLSRQPVEVEGERWQVERMPGWYEFIFRNVRSGSRRAFNLDQLAREMSGPSPRAQPVPAAAVNGVRPKPSAPRGPRVRGGPQGRPPSPIGG